MQDSSGRVPPHNPQAERGVLGSLLLSCGDSSVIFERLVAADFFNRRHQVIYQAIQELYDRDASVDTILLREKLERDGVLEEVGGLDYLVDLTESVQTSANAEHYASIVKERGLLRSLIDTCTDIVKEAYEDPGEATVQLDRAEQKIFEISETTRSDEVTPLRDAIQSTFDLLDRWAKGNLGTPTGFVDLDNQTNGLQPSELIVVAGRPSMGKTTFSMNVARNIALQAKKGVLVFSLEVDKTQMALNLLCSTARASASKVRSNDISTRLWQQLTAGAARLSEAQIFIDDSPNLNAMTIRAKARRMKAKHDIGLIVIDYLQLLEHGGRRHDNRQQEITAISRSLKLMARELEVPVITISQLSRAVESREDHRPRMSDLRESGAIEQDADVILLLYREEYYKPESEEAKGRAEVIVAKQRNGPVGSIPLAFRGDHLSFDNLSYYQEEF